MPQNPRDERTAIDIPVGAPTPQTPPNPDGAPMGGIGGLPMTLADAVRRERARIHAREAEANAPPAPGEFVADPTLVRQSSLPLTLPETVGVVGCGGVGSWIAYFLALAGVRHLLLFDSDTVSESNLNRMPYGPANYIGGKWGEVVHTPKTEALKHFISQVRPQCKCECYPNLTPAFATALNIHPGSCQWLVASTDSLASRQDTAKWCRDNEVAYIEAAAEGDFGSVSDAPAEFATEAETQPGYASVPVWVGPCVAAASMACSHILHGCIHQDTSARIGWSADLGRMEFTAHNRNDKAPASGALSYEDVIMAPRRPLNRAR